MRRSSWWAALPLLTALGGCLDFVDPVGLGLTQAVRVNANIRVVDNASAPCGSLPSTPTAGPERMATVCVEASVFPGTNKLGEWRRMGSDTLWVLGEPVLPQVTADSSRHYQFRALVPEAQLHRLSIWLKFPTVEGVEITPGGIRWNALGRAGADSVRVAPGGDVRLQVQLPEQAANPRPSGQSWSMAVSGQTSTVLFTGSGVPRAEYVFPGAVLADLGGSSYSAGLRWTRSLFSSTAELHVFVQQIQEMRWRIVPEAG